jgi:hypothetical protein
LAKSCWRKNERDPQCCERDPQCCERDPLCCERDPRCCERDPRCCEHDPQCFSANNRIWILFFFRSKENGGKPRWVFTPPQNTPWHLLMECPATLTARKEIPPGKWTTGNILKDIKKMEFLEVPFEPQNTQVLTLT